MAQTQDQFFISEPGVPLTKAALVASVRKGLHADGVDEHLYSDHDFQFGAATKAVQVGMEDSLIQKLGK